MPPVPRAAALDAAPVPASPVPVQRIELIPLRQLQQIGWPGNAKRHEIDVILRMIHRNGFVSPGIIDETSGRLVVGHGRGEALVQLRDGGPPSWWGDAAWPPERLFVQGDDWLVPIIRGVAFATLADAEAYVVGDNQTTILGGWANDLLVQSLERLKGVAAGLSGTGFTHDDVARLVKDLGAARPVGPTLAKRFLVPPLSVLDARQGYWQDRKRAWHQIGLEPEAGREQLPATAAQGVAGYDYIEGRGPATGGSVFDPVLCEIAYRWFCPPRGSILDPFAGEATKGIVAAYLGYLYTGIELREDQVAANDRQAKRVGVAPLWHCGDSAKLDELLRHGEQYDLIWTSPPYFDLEIYSRSKRDGSAFETYEKFIAWYADIMGQAVARLRDNRFVGVKVGEVRDKRLHSYRGFVTDNAAIFRKLGLHYYNEAILVTPLGSVPVRAAGAFTASRKLAKTHQNVLWFYKGDPRKIGDHFPAEIEVGDVALSGEAAAG